MRPNRFATAAIALTLASGICLPGVALAAEPADAAASSTPVETATQSQNVDSSAPVSNGSATITVGAITGKPGQTVQIPVSISSTVNLSGAHLAFTYDPSLITVTDVRATGFLANASQLSFRHKVLPSGQVQVAWSIPQTQGISANGAMYLLEAVVAPAASNGSNGTITGSIVDEGVLDSDTNTVSTTFVAGRASVSFIPGDVNGNNTINIVDAQCIYDMVIGSYGSSSANYPTFPLPDGWSADTLLRLADANEDGQINVLDARAAQVKALEG